MHRSAPRLRSPLACWLLVAMVGATSGCGSAPPAAGTPAAKTAAATQEVKVVRTRQPIDRARSHEYRLDFIPVLYQDLGWPPLVKGPPTMTKERLERHDAARDQIEKAMTLGGVRVVSQENDTYNFTDIRLDEPWTEGRYCIVALSPWAGQQPAFGDHNIRVVNDLHEVRVLQLRELPITDAGLAELAPMPNLHRIDLVDTQVTDKGLALLSKLAPRLTNLTVSNLGDGSVPMLLAQQYLVQLHLSDCKLTDQGFQQIAPKLFYLEEFSLTNHTLSDEALAALSGAVELRTLGLGPASPAALAALAPLPHLEWLQAHGVSKAGLEKLPLLPKLTRLSLRKPAFSAEDVALLTGCKGLEDLSIDDLPLTDQSFETFGKLTKLKKLNLSGAKTTAEGLAKFRQDHPQVAVEASTSK